jgi:fumarylacetoacetase
VTVAVELDFGRTGLPYGVFSVPGRNDAPRVGAAFENGIIDLAALLGDVVFAAPTLHPFMAAGREAWTSVRSRLQAAVDQGDVAGCFVAATDAVLHLPFEVADFVDFNSSLQHAANTGRILRPGDDPVRPNWLRLPVGYHGRTGTVVASGTPVTRPHGQHLDERGAVVFSPTEKLDVEAEIGFVVGRGSTMGEPIRTGAFTEHVFGAVLVLDWSARDIQAFEYVPLGPFLGKSFATTISPWVYPVAALDASRVASPVQNPVPADYLRVDGNWGFDVRLELSLNGNTISRPRFDSMYWTPPQQLAHLTANGASVRTGDLFASGTVSDADEFGSLLELTVNGTKPLTLSDGSHRGFLADGDEVTLSGTVHAADGARHFMGMASGVVLQAHALPRVEATR